MHSINLKVVLKIIKKKVQEIKTKKKLNYDDNDIRVKSFLKFKANEKSLSWINFSISNIVAKSTDKITKNIMEKNEDCIVQYEK